MRIWRGCPKQHELILQCCDMPLECVCLRLCIKYLCLEVLDMGVGGREVQGMLAAQLLSCRAEHLLDEGLPDAPVWQSTAGRYRGFAQPS